MVHQGSLGPFGWAHYSPEVKTISNIKMLFGFLSPSFSHECIVEFLRAYVVCDTIRDWMQKQLLEPDDV